MFTMLLTVWVLVAEDIKQIGFEKDADFAFGVIGISCIAIFSVEILLSSIGRKDYFPGFFFVLDIVSTASLVLDLPWISEPIIESEEGGGTSGGAEKGRTARLGARSARVVRLVRLVRIAKLYKAIYEALGVGKTVQRRSKPGQADDDDDEGLGDESRVGKKLSDLTIKRVIVLVLSMLIFVPMMEVPEDTKYPSSAQYGADEVSARFEEASDGGHASRLQYERAMLRYIYYHNWFSGNGECPPGPGVCPKLYYSHLYWVGIAGVTSQDAVEAAARTARLTPETVRSWAANVSRQEGFFNYGDIPVQALDLLSAPWETCQDSGGKFRYGVSLLKNGIPGTPAEHPVPCHSDLRAIERDRYEPMLLSTVQFDTWHFEFWFDSRPFQRASAEMNVLTTVFVCVVLCAAAMMFYNDVNQAVLYPVEGIVRRVQAIRDDPLEAIKMAERKHAQEVACLGSADGGAKDTVTKQMKRLLAAAELGDQVLENNLATTKSEEIGPTATSSTLRRVGSWLPEEEPSGRGPFFSQVARLLACMKQDTSEPMETVVLEKTIIKLGSLLALGFGEAGAQIIASNMVATSYGVNVMVPGQRKECVIGNARIQNFSVATEVLQSRVMTFVNQVAEIVHGVVEEHHGAASRNNGDTFLVIWRCHRGAGMLARDEHLRESKISDMSVLAFAKIIGAIHRSPVIAQYRYHPGLQNKLGTDFRVHLTCGLHAGWAIEGAVGSEYKIEASYLSPNVEVAVNVEAATQIYNVNFLASEAVVKNCCQGMRDKCRLIDRVVVPGSKIPVQLFSIDLDVLNIEVGAPSKLPTFGARLRVFARQYLEVQRRNKPKHDVETLFDEDLDIQTMRREVSDDFLEIFRMGYQNYAEGEWQVAQKFLEETCVLRGSVDGPSVALIRFMESFGFEAPPGWRGVHDLSDFQAAGVGLSSAARGDGACSVGVGLSSAARGDGAGSVGGRTGKTLRYQM